LYGKSLLCAGAQLISYRPTSLAVGDNPCCRKHYNRHWRRRSRQM